MAAECSGKAVSFICTSGTTGNIKFIPESEKGNLIKQKISSLRFYEMARLVPEMASPDVKIFAITNIFAALYTEGGIPMGKSSSSSHESVKTQLPRNLGRESK